VRSRRAVEVMEERRQWADIIHDLDWRIAMLAGKPHMLIVDLLELTLERESAAIEAGKVGLLVPESGWVDPRESKVM
jgi:hypothetical protein